MLHHIYIIRHGETENASMLAAIQDGQVAMTPELLATIDDGDVASGSAPASDEATAPAAPTGNRADQVLSQVGIEQSNETAARLAQMKHPIDVVYCSPHYHCLETLRPIVMDGDKVKYKVRVELGLRGHEDIDDLYPLCPGQCALKKPTDVAVLKHFFQYINPNYHSIIQQPCKGWRAEAPRHLLRRAHFTIDHIIRDLDRAKKTQTVLICTHAPLILAIARVLTEWLPPRVDFERRYRPWLGATFRELRCIARDKFIQPDHKTSHCSISRFDRIAPGPDWAWALTMDGEQSHLANPGERWRFRPSMWQNRHPPNPVAAIFRVFREGPTGLWIRAREGSVDLWVWGRQSCTALRQHFRTNAYRLPGFIFGTLWMLGALRCFWLLLRGSSWSALKQTGTGSQAELEALRDWAKDLLEPMLTLLAFMLFMFPPLIGS